MRSPFPTAVVLANGAAKSSDCFGWQYRCSVEVALSGADAR